MTAYYSEPLQLEVKGRFLFVNGEAWEFGVRTISQMNEVLMEKQKFKTDYPLYFMFRSVAQRNGIRYDVTLIPPKKLGNEFAKTYGHYHPYAKDKLGYPEIYQVLEGKAFFILQKKRGDASVDAIVTYGPKGSIVLIPPNYGHVTVNGSAEEKLVLANLVADGFESDYTDYRENRGGAYYVTDEGLEQNMKYIIRTSEKKKPEEINSEYGFVCSDLLKELFASPEKFEFLKDPTLLSR